MNYTFIPNGWPKKYSNCKLDDAMDMPNFSNLTLPSSSIAALSCRIIEAIEEFDVTFNFT